jgi:hypothetical protein
MSIIMVQCKGSGQAAGQSFNVKRAMCRHCHRQQDVASNGNFRKHMRRTTTAQLRKGRAR